MDGYALFALRQALIEGEASGDFAPFDFDAFIAEKRTLSRPVARECSHFLAAAVVDGARREAFSEHSTD